MGSVEVSGFLKKAKCFLTPYKRSFAETLGGSRDGNHGFASPACGTTWGFPVMQTWSCLQTVIVWTHLGGSSTFYSPILN